MCSCSAQKDYQQVTLLRLMIEDLRLPVAVRVGATLREADGLAMSSRNRYLDAAQRRQAPALHAALETAARRSAVGRQGLRGARAPRRR